MSRVRAAVVATAALALTGSGCAADDVGRGPETLRIYVSAPLQGERAVEGGAIEDGARLALARAGGRIDRFRVRGVFLDDSDDRGWSIARTAANARRAAQDTTAIGYVGDVDSGATKVSLPITNQAEIPQVSPASGAVGLTRLSKVGSDPDRFRPNETDNFARVVPDDDVQGRAAAAWAKQMGARTFAAGGDRSDFGRASADAFASEAASLGMRPFKPDGSSTPLSGPAEGADAVWYGLASIPRNDAFAGALGATDSTLFGPPALADPALLHADPGVEGRLRLVSPFLDPALLPSAAKPFLRTFKGRYGHTAPPAAAYGYEAMALLLDSIRRAGDDGDARGAVIDELLSTTERRSVLGTYSIDGNGDTTLDAVTGYRVGDGLAVFPVRLNALR